MSLSNNDVSFLRLIMRSPDRGDGWRSVSKTVWPLVEKFGEPDLLEIDPENMRIRPSEKGATIIQYAL